METNKGLEQINSKFIELKREELQALAKEELEEYTDRYLKVCDIKFEESLKKMDRVIEEFESLANDCINEDSDENREKLGRFVEREM